MKLPHMKYADNIRRSTQEAFGGYNHTARAGDGEIYDMTNMSSARFPLLTPRGRRGLVTTLTKPNGIGAGDKLYYVDGTGFIYDGAAKGTVADSAKTFAEMGAYIIIMPDKVYYNKVTNTFGSLESKWSDSSLTFQDGYIYEEAAAANCVYHASTDWTEYFKVGDAVTISGCVTHPENNKTPIIREFSSDKHGMYFYENTFKLTTEGVPYTETGTLKVERTVPDMDYICASENRLWGCKGDSIYASKLGDPTNFNVFDGLGTDAWSVSAGSPGSFTGCAVYAAFPVFFKDDKVFKVYGSLPSNYELTPSARLGVLSGAGKSLAIAGETLFYLSRAGIVAYSGGLPSPVYDAFGDVKYIDAVAGSDGRCYYVSMTDGTAYSLFVYDTQNNVWHREDASQAVGFAFYGGALHMLLADGKLYDLSGRTGTAEAAVSWKVEFGDFTERDMNKKAVSKLIIRAELASGASMKVYIKYDSGGLWEEKASLSASAKKSFAAAVLPRRSDHWRLKLTGTGEVSVSAIAREYCAENGL